MLPYPETRYARLHQKTGHATIVPLVRIGQSKYNHEIGYWTVRAKGLGAVEPKTIAIWCSASMQGESIRTGSYGASPAAGDAEDERWSFPQTATFVALSSVGLWTLIVAAARWLLG